MTLSSCINVHFNPFLEASLYMVYSVPYTSKVKMGTVVNRFFNS